MNATVTELLNVSQGPDLNESRTNNLIELGLYISFEVCIALFAFINNLLVLVALWKFRSLRTPTNWFVASLAVADIAVAVFAIPNAIILRLGLSVVHAGCDDVSGPSVGEPMCCFMVTSVLMLTQVSIFGLLTIAVDRFIAINYPFKYESVVTKNRTRIAILGAWVIGILVGVAPELVFSVWSEETHACDRNTCEFEEVVSMEYMVYVNFFGCVLVPLVAMGVLYFFIFRSAKKQLRKIYFDVKNLKRKHGDSRGIEFVEAIRHAASSTIFELKNGHKKHSKSSSKFSRAQSAPPFHGSELDIQRTGNLDGPRTVSRDVVFDSVRNQSGSPSEMKELTNEKSETRTVDDNSCEQLLAPSNQDKGENCGHLYENVSPSPLMSRQSSRTPNLREIRNYKAYSTSYDGNELQSCETTARSDGENELRPHGKAHSFSVTSSIKKPHTLHFHKNSVNHVKATPTIPSLVPSSLSSSRFSMYTSELGGYSTTDCGKLQRKMKRKRELLKKEFRAARSLATVVGLFAICWLPLHVMNTITLLCTDCAPQPPWLKDLAILLSHANSLINPLIYAYKMRDFRSAFRRILTPFVGSDGKTSPISSSSSFGTVKWCCIVTSRSDVIHDCTSDEKSGSGDSFKEKQKFLTRSTNNNNNAVTSNTPVRPRLDEISNEKNQNDGQTANSRYECTGSLTNSSSESNASDMSSSSDQLTIRIPHLDTAIRDLLDSPESVV